MKDYFGYKGKICVVTGAASGMGKATAEILLDLGAEVYGLDFNEANLPGLKFVQVNLSEKDSIDKAFEELPAKFDKFFGVAGVSGLSTTFEVTLTINFAANKYITEAYLADRLNDGGAIAFVSSVAGSKWYDHENEYKDIVSTNTWEEIQAAIAAKVKGELPGVIAYVVSKRAISYYTKWIVPDFGKRGIRVNSIAPGLTTSGLLGDFEKLSGGQEKAGEKMFGIFERSAESKEMGSALAFLNSDMASYISGVQLFVDAGREALIKTHDAYDNNAAPMPI
ncbi:MAG: SDR family oxidoreductase [Clostridiales Family XIII bacterium]|jgi:NAD(P)-dependent dehydrogenase (short-subunit alcohol dehydrogenase family)|nr:SDR family oxidoreductase [Clostridiales Family XIII bacterium]